MTSRLREFRLPDLGEGLLTAEIIRWCVAVGDTVQDGGIVCEVETAKATVELPVPYDGVVRGIHAAEGATVDVGTPIISIETSAAAPVPADADPTDAGPGDARTGDTGPVDTGPVDARPAVLVGYGVPAPSRSRWAMRRAGRGVRPPLVSNGGSPLPAAKPPVRRLARDLGVDLTAVEPSGAGGTVTRADVQAAAEGASGRPALRQPRHPAAPPDHAGRERRIPVTGIRKATARAMVASAFTVPHATESITVDVTRTVELARRLRDDPLYTGVRVTPLLLVARALLVALARHPEANAAWDDARQEIVVKEYVNLGIAVTTPRGLLVPNVKQAQALSLAGLARELDELVTRARAGRTAPAEMVGGTCTITNIGALGVDTGTPILNPGESLILAFGAVRERPWVHDGAVRPRPVSTLTLSFDHRLMDGDLGARVLCDVAAVLEDPERLVAWT